MREILFRGRRSYNQEWVCGNLITDECGKMSIVQSETVEVDGHHLRICSDDPMFFDQETIGQFTGLTDKNGVKLFGNSDKFKFKWSNDNKIVNLIGVFVYDDDELRWEIDMSNSPHYVVLSYDPIKMSDFEVIGNIYNK